LLLPFASVYVYNRKPEHGAWVIFHKGYKMADYNCCGGCGAYIDATEYFCAGEGCPSWGASRCSTHNDVCIANPYIERIVYEECYSGYGDVYFEPVGRLPPKWSWGCDDDWSIHF
jgi:hypothetical protein